MKKVMVFGTFDIIHPGHLHMLLEAKEYGDFLIVVIARDLTVCAVKGKATRNTEEVRLGNVKRLKIVDKARLGCVDDDKYLVIAEEKPDIIALGYDQRAFVDKLIEAVEDYVQIVRLTPHLPEIYKSSKLK